MMIATDNEALKSICRILGLRVNNPTLGVQYAICLHHKSRSSLLCIQRVFNLKYKPFAFRALNSLNIEQPFSEDSENHATSHANLQITKSHRSHLQALPTDLGLHYQWIVPSPIFLIHCQNRLRIV